MNSITHFSHLFLGPGAGLEPATEAPQASVLPLHHPSREETGIIFKQSFLKTILTLEPSKSPNFALSSIGIVILPFESTREIALKEFSLRLMN